LWYQGIQKRFMSGGIVMGVRFSTTFPAGLPGSLGGMPRLTAHEPGGTKVGSVWKMADGRWYAIFGFDETIRRESCPMPRRFDAVQWIIGEYSTRARPS
jgi:hypothetical protein